VVGYSLIAGHTDAKKKYGNFTIAATDRLVGPYWLDQIAQDPTAPLYMHTMDLRDEFTFWSVARGYRHRTTWKEIRGLKDVMMNRVSGLVEQSPYVAQLASMGADSEFWMKRIFAGFSGEVHYAGPESILYIGLFSLTLLPNVTNLTLPWTSPPMSGDNIEVARRLLHMIQHEARFGPGDRSLGKLKRLNLYYSSRRRVYDSLLSFMALLALPKLEEFHASNLAETLNVRWPYPYRFNLRTVHLTSCCLTSHVVSGLLANMPNLATFKYSHAFSRSPSGDDHEHWDPASIIDAVEKQVGNQLRHLAITIEPGRVNKIGHGVTSMRGFTRLETLEIDVMLFVAAGRVVSSPVPPESSDPTKSQALPESGDDVRSRSIRDANLEAENILPKSLQRLDLYFNHENDRGRHVAAVDTLISRLASCRPVLPDLSHFMVHIRSNHDNPPSDSDSSEWEPGISPNLELLCLHLVERGIEHRCEPGAMPPWRSGSRL